MASTIKVDNIQDQCGTAVITKCGATHTVTAEVYKANTIQDTSGNAYLAKCGTTVTLGGCGQTIALAAGASQSGFGRTGTVDWDTTAKTTNFTAVSGNGYFVDTTSGVVTVTLPATPSAGDIVAVADYAGTTATNKITIDRNGSLVEGVAANAQVNSNRQTVTLVYVDGTQGWVPVNESNQSFLSPAYVTATGGTITTCGDYKYHKFTGPGTFCVSCVGNPAGNNNVQLLIVAGGGAGAARYGGGGGAGGLILTPACGIPVSSATGFPVTVGGGGTGTPNPCGATGTPGANSTAFSLTSIGGGGGRHASVNLPAQAGGSGGATGQASPPNIGPSIQSSQPGNSGAYGFGNPSGDGSSSAPSYGHAGGGGACGAGGNGTPGAGGSGGAGKLVTSLFPAPLGGSPAGYYAGGGGGGTLPGSNAGGGSPGGGASGDGSPGNAGTTNTGGGGGGSNGNVQTAGGNGGSGIVIIRYKFQN